MDVKKFNPLGENGLHAYMPTCIHFRHYMHTLPSRFALMKSDDLTVRRCSNVLMLKMPPLSSKRVLHTYMPTCLHHTYIHAYMPTSPRYGYMHTCLHRQHTVTHTCLRCSGRRARLDRHLMYFCDSGGFSGPQKMAKKDPYTQNNQICPKSSLNSYF